MLNRTRSFAIAGLCVAAFLVADARAQDNESPVRGGVPAAVDSEIEGTADSDKASHSKSAVARMRVILTAVLKYLTEARDEKDVVKLNCVNEKLTAIKGLLRISEQADVTLQEALARRDTEVSAHEFEKIVIAQRKCEQLLAESEACVGELAVYAGDTEVELILENVPEEDPADADVNEVVLITRPPAASPFQ